MPGNEHSLLELLGRKLVGLVPLLEVAGRETPDLGEFTRSQLCTVEKEFVSLPAGQPPPHAPDQDGRDDEEDEAAHAATRVGA